MEEEARQEAERIAFEKEQQRLAEIERREAEEREAERIRQEEERIAAEKEQ